MENHSNDNPPVRQRRTVRERPLLGAPSVGFRLRTETGDFILRLSGTLRSLEESRDRRDASQTRLLLEQLYKRGGQFHDSIPEELHAAIRAHLGHGGLAVVKGNRVPYPRELRQSLDRLLGRVS